MLYGKDSPILKSRTKPSSQNQFGKLMSKSTDPKAATMSSIDDNLVSDEDEYGDETVESPMIYSIRPVEESKTQEVVKVTHAAETSGEDVGKKPRSIFRHLFEPKLLTDGLDKDLDTMSLEMQCLDCLIKAPLTSMYCHAVHTHFLNLCIYCLATFQNGRQLEIHLLRHHRIQSPNCPNFREFDDIYKAGEVELFCSECNKPVVLGEKPDGNELAVAQHSCTSDEDEVLCCKCARQYSLKEIKSHIKICDGQVVQKKNPINMMPLFMIKQEPEDIDLTKSSDSSPTKSISPVKQLEPARLRNRDNRCKLCLEIVPASKTAQHALACVGKSVAKPASSPEKVQTASKRLTPRFQKTSPRRQLSSQEGPSTDSSVNGGEVAADPQNLTENMEFADECYSASSNHRQDAASATPGLYTPLEPCDSVQSNDIHTSLHQPHTLSSFKDDVDIESANPSLTKETAETSCDMSIDHVSNTIKTDETPVPKYEDALLNEEDPDRRRSLLVNELCDFLERKYRDELRRNDNMDMRKRDVDLYQPINELSGDEILEIMISNACIGCTYCRQAKIVGVDRRELVIHLLTRHTWDLKFHATPESQIQNETTGDDETTAEAPTMNDLDKPKMKVDWSQFRVTLLEKVFQLSNNIFNFRCKEPFGECPCECLLCGCHIITQRQLFPHWIKAHARMSMKCYMCHENFLFAGALFSHLCFGTPEPLIREQEPEQNESRMINGGNEESTTSAQGDDDRTALLRYQCRLCDNFQFPGFFNYTVHLRTDHVLCELCLQPLADQKELQNHILKKHKLNLYCWKCRFGYLDLNSFFSHMFWKHGNASVVCNMCCEKKWSFVYHFCRPPTEFVCDICKERFSKPMSLKVHKRLHSGEQLRKCPKHNCQERFISRKLLERHVDNVHNNPNNTTANEEASESQETEAGPTQESPIPCDNEDDNMREYPTVNETVVAAHQPADEENKNSENTQISQSENSVNSFDVGSVENTADTKTPKEDNGTTVEAESTRQDSYSGEYTGSHQVVSPFAVPMSSSEFNSSSSGNNATESDKLPAHASEGGLQTETEENSIHSSTLRPDAKDAEEASGEGVDESDKPFDISEFKGPNLSEDESDSEVPSETKRPKASSPIIDTLSDEDIETNAEKNQFNLDLNGHENFFDRIHSPDMANYEHLLQEDDNDMDTNEGPCSDISINLPEVSKNIDSHPPEDEPSDCQATYSEPSIQTEDSTNIQTVSKDLENIPADTRDSENVEAVTECLENIQEVKKITETFESIQAVIDASAPAKVDNVEMGLPEITKVVNVEMGLPEITTLDNVDMGLPESIQSESSETVSATEPEKRITQNCRTDLHQDLLLSSDSSDDETGEKETAECEGPESSVVDAPISINQTNDTTEPLVSENGIHEPIANVFDETDSSGNKTTQSLISFQSTVETTATPCLQSTTTSESALQSTIPLQSPLQSAITEGDLESQYKIRRNAEGIDPDSMPEHIRFDNAVFTLEHEHDYYRKVDPDGRDEYEKEQGRMGNGSPSRIADESSIATHELQRSTTAPSQFNSTESAETSHSRKRTRSSSSSSSSSGSSSSGSSSGSSSDSSGSDSEEDDQSEDDNTSTSTPQSSSSPHKHYSMSDNSYYDHPTYAAHQTSTPVASTPVKRGRGRPKGSLNRDKFGVPTAKKFQQNRSTGSNKVSRMVDDAYKPRRKYRKTKGKGGRPKSTAALEKENERRQETVNPNTIPESDLETEDSGSEDVFHNKQLTEPIGSKIPVSNALWNISNEEYLLRLLRGVENLEKLRMITEMEAQAAIANRKRMAEMQKQIEVNTAQVPTKRSVSTRKPVQQLSNPGPALHVSQPVVPSTPVRQAKVKIGKGRGRGRGRQIFVNDRNNVDLETSPIRPPVPVMRIDLGGANSSSGSLRATISTTSSKTSKQKTKNREHWCICQKPYDGLAMIKCESNQCPYEWYHFDCIGLTEAEAPAGKWYCRLEGCRSAKTRKRKRQNERLVGHYTH